MKKIHHAALRPGRGKQHAAFSLVEVALALGIVGFALAGLIGAIPLAANTGRQSIAQSRAASVASTVFANFRAGSFSKAQYLDPAGGSGTSGTSTTSATDTLDLNAKTGSDTITFFAYFDETAVSASASDPRRLHLVPPANGDTSISPPANATSPAVPPGTPLYRIVLRFNNNPPGTLAPYTATPGAAVKHAQANAVETSICALDRPKDVYRFNSVIANRSE